MITQQDFDQALQTGAVRVTAWADLLDGINVFPVADGDTGRNLVYSLSPLIQADSRDERLIERLLMLARGNSGNIAVQFLRGVLQAEYLSNLPAAVKQGRDLAWQALPDPREGTMLSLLDELALALQDHYGEDAWVESVLERLVQAVRRTTQQLQDLQQAGVVDSGALGLFLFFDGFLQRLSGIEQQPAAVAKLFDGQLRLNADLEFARHNGNCIDALIKRNGETGEKLKDLEAFGESIVALEHGEFVKLHLHGENEALIKQRLAELGEVLRYKSDDLNEQTSRFVGARKTQAVHVMTDAAGSMTREQATELNLTLLDSYITVGDHCLPESYIDRDDLYRRMLAGESASTAQASQFERQQFYRKVCDLYPKVLYLAVGSVFTGNVDAAQQWKSEADPEDRLSVLDSGAASGKLGLSALAVARYAQQETQPEKVVTYARQVIETCEEYLFIETLRYLARGGRLSKTSAFFGNMLGLKPVVSPYPDGARKLAMLRNRKDQLAFLQKRLDQSLPNESTSPILLQYTDNRSWVETELLDWVRQQRSAAEIVVTPLSLTTGVHAGPGAWSVAFLPSVPSK